MVTLVMQITLMGWYRIILYLLLTKFISVLRCWVCFLKNQERLAVEQNYNVEIPLPSYEEVLEIERSKGLSRIYVSTGDDSLYYRQKLFSVNLRKKVVYVDLVRHLQVPQRANAVVLGIANSAVESENLFSYATFLSRSIRSINMSGVDPYVRNFTSLQKLSLYLSAFSIGLSEESLRCLGDQGVVIYPCDIFEKFACSSDFNKAYACLVNEEKIHIGKKVYISIPQFSRYRTEFVFSTRIPRERFVAEGKVNSIGLPSIGGDIVSISGIRMGLDDFYPHVVDVPEALRGRRLEPTIKIQSRRACL